MSSIQKLTEVGKEYGLKGPDLLDFVRKEQAREREEREYERRLTKEEQEKERQRVRENQEIEHSRALELLAAKREVATAEAAAGGPKISKCVGPKLPPFDDKHDNMDSYLSRFERYAVLQGWGRNSWAVHLSALLRGKALDVYARLPIDVAEDYDGLKAAVLVAFELTEEGFRKRFRSCRPEVGETFVQFLSKSRKYLERWLEMGKVEKSYEGVVDFLLRDQLTSICARELYLYIKEKRIRSAPEMAAHADDFAEARGGVSGVVVKESSHDGGYRDRHKGRDRERMGRSEEGNVSGKVGRTIPEQNKYRGDKKCYNCGGNHLAYQCKNRNVSYKAAGAEGQGYRRDQSRGRDRSHWYNRSQRKDHGYEESSYCVSPEGIRSETVYDQIGTCVFTESRIPKAIGKLNGLDVTVMRDTGCTGVVVRKSLVEGSQILDKTSSCVFLNKSVQSVPVARITVESPFFNGVTEALCLDDPMYDLTIGNINGSSLPTMADFEIQAVETRGMKTAEKKGLPKLKVPGMVGDVSREEFLEEQHSDRELDKLRNFADKGSVKVTKSGAEVKFVADKGLLYRKFQPSRGKECSQLVVPGKFRRDVLKVSHESLMAGHMGTNRTLDRVLSEFYWPGVGSTVRRFCQSCDVCQRTVPKGRIGKVPLGSMPIIDTPFKRVAVDIVGPIEPVTDRKNRYILTLVDYATRYPEAVALPSIETERVADALVDMFCRVGVPEEMLTDCGAQFTSGVMSEVSRLLSVRRLTTTPYHPMCNGLVERFNGTLKQMLKRMCQERPKDWDRFLNPVLFAYREVPSESLGFSPFELLYGRRVRGPMSILKQFYSGKVDDPEVKSTYQYVLDLKEKLRETCDLAHDQLGKCARKYRKFYNRKAKDRRFVVGERVLVLLPTSHNKLLLSWKGPFKVIRVANRMDYEIEMNGKKKLFHANMLKRYLERKELVSFSLCEELFTVVNAAMIEEEEGEEFPLVDTGISQETMIDVDICQELSVEQGRDVRELLAEFSDVLTDRPGRTHLIQHDIKVNTKESLKVKGYPIPFHARSTVREEVEKMVALDIIEPSSAPFSSPVVLVKKKDHTTRFCIDFRKLNKVTVIDAEPMPNMDDKFSRLSGFKYFSKIDLSKAYWQIPLTESAKSKTAFETEAGLMQFKVMPFGLVNAASSFCRLMRLLLKGMVGVDNFMDDIWLFSVTWLEHITVLRELLARLRAAHLTARPKKCSIGYTTVECLGHFVSSDNRLSPNPDKVKAILSAVRPQTKTQVRSFLGLVGFYRRFIPNFSAIAVPLTDLTKKGQPNKVSWGDIQERAFQSLKSHLVQEPILHLPDIDKGFIVRTDASDSGIGAVLLQEHDSEKFPVAFASRKLLPREQNYAVIEKECLAIVWAVEKFYKYLFGREFELETDHQPLIYLNKAKVSNARLMRWALTLQPYRFHIRAIRGKDNVGADYLSRV